MEELSFGTLRKASRFLDRYQKHYIRFTTYLSLPCLSQNSSNRAISETVVTGHSDTLESDVVRRDPIDNRSRASK